MRAFNSNPQLKADLLRQIKLHRKQDKIIKGTYGVWSPRGEFGGCAVGCTIHSYGLITGLILDTCNHSNYELFGIPADLAMVEVMIFENLPVKQCLLWPEQFISTINVGSNLSRVYGDYLMWLNSLTKPAMSKIIDLYDTNTPEKLTADYSKEEKAKIYKDAIGQRKKLIELLKDCK